jgi:hypothetical protein
VAFWLLTPRGDPSQSSLLRSLKIYMGNEGPHFRIADRFCSSDIQFVLCRKPKVIDAADPISLRERTTLKVTWPGCDHLLF